jgi:CubicO group peptidase (beta-lactamase class C family)
MTKASVSYIRRAIILLLLAVMVYAFIYAYKSFPIITGYSAKMACSCIFLSNRSLNSVEQEELGGFPLKLASVSLNAADSSVTATIAGTARQTAIYRPKLGCTLVNELTAAVIKQQPLPANRWVAEQPDTLAWPMGDRIAAEHPAGVNELLLQQAVSAAFNENIKDKPLRTRAVLVVFNGQLIAEKYAAGFDRHTRQLGWSMAKSITSALTGILVGQGKLEVDKPAPVPEWHSVKDGREKITLQQLLQQTTGLDFEENYAKASGATNMLFRKANMGAYVAGMLLKDVPGKVFYYSSGNTNILSRIIRKTVGEQQYLNFPATALFNKIGMYSAVMEPDAAGNFVGSSYVFATARDWARFGLLYANEGVWAGERILPEGWVKSTTTPSSVVPLGKYGYQFWLNAGDPANQLNRRFNSLPPDMFYADGYEGQFVFVIPSKQLVVVRLGQSAGDRFNVPEFLEPVLAAIADKPAHPR